MKNKIVSSKHSLKISLPASANPCGHRQPSNLAEELCGKMVLTWTETCFVCCLADRQRFLDFFLCQRGGIVHTNLVGNCAAQGLHWNARVHRNTHEFAEAEPGTGMKTGLESLMWWLIKVATCTAIACPPRSCSEKMNILMPWILSWIVASKIPDCSQIFLLS